MLLFLLRTCVTCVMGATPMHSVTNVVLYVNLLKRVQGGLVLAMELTSKIKEFTYFTSDSPISFFRLLDLI